MSRKKAHCSSIFTVISYPTIGTTFGRLSSEAVSVLVVRVLIYNMVSQLLSNISASEPADMGRSGKSKIFTVSPTLYGFYVKEARFSMRSATA